MADQEGAAGVGEIGTLPEAPAELADILFGDHADLGQGAVGELAAAVFLVIGVFPEVRLMVPLQKAAVLPGVVGDEELQHLPVLNAPIQVVPHKDIEGVIPQTVISQGFLKHGAAAVEITDDGDLAVGGEILGLNGDDAGSGGVHGVLPVLWVFCSGVVHVCVVLGLCLF